MKRYQNTLKLMTEQLIASVVPSSQSLRSAGKSVGRRRGPSRVLIAQLPDADNRPMHTQTEFMPSTAIQKFCRAVPKAAVGESVFKEYVCACCY